MKSIQEVFSVFFLPLPSPSIGEKGKDRNVLLLPVEGVAENRGSFGGPVGLNRPGSVAA